VAEVRQFALLYGYQWSHPGKKLLFMGGEFGQWREWSEERSLDWHLIDENPLHGGVQKYVARLNELYKSESRCLPRIIPGKDFTGSIFGTVNAVFWRTAVKIPTPAKKSSSSATSPPSSVTNTASACPTRQLRGNIEQRRPRIRRQRCSQRRRVHRRQHLLAQPTPFNHNHVAAAGSRFFKKK
jgi:hypothetical protein